MAGLFRVYARRPFLVTTPTPVSSSICHISDHWHSRLLRASRERPCGRYNPKQRDEVAAPHGDLPQGKDHELSITGQPVHRSKSRPLMSGQGQKRRTKAGSGFVRCPLYPQERTSFRSIPPPTLCERGHRALACHGVAVRRRRRR